MVLLLYAREREKEEDERLVLMARSMGLG